MSAARPPEGAKAPLGGSDPNAVGERGGEVSAARPPEGAKAPLGLSAAAPAVPAHSGTARRDGASGAGTSSDPNAVGERGGMVRARALHALMRALSWLPLPLLRALGAALGMLLWLLVPARRRVVLTNLRWCFPEWSVARRRQVARAVFRAFGQSWLDRSWLWHAPAPRVRQRLRLSGALEALAGEAPVVLFAPHFMGLDAAWTALNQQVQRRFVTIYSPQTSPAVDAWVYGGRQRFGQPTLVARLDGAQPLVAAVRAGQPLYLLPDMNFDPSESLWVPFFGPLAATVPSLSRFARLGRARVLPVLTRLVPGGYEVRILPAWEGFPSGDLQADTERMNRELEAYIRQDPAQYYWVHKRFKDRPDGASAPY
ncbi:MAG: lysophospholipid acyltransferase family protein [Rhodoferax sp.]